MIFFTSDPHYYHENVIKYCGRPWKNATLMNAALIQFWNETVAPEDTVYVVGDVTLEKEPERLSKIIPKLNGMKHLILGNHDGMKVWAYLDCGFTSVHTALRAFEFKNHLVYMAHDPAIKTALPKEAFLIHGHVHQLWTYQEHTRLINVGVDVWNYRPVSMSIIEQWMDTRREL